MLVKSLENSLTAAKYLLGCKLSHTSKEGTTSGIIVETEAYHSDDPASHTFSGQTIRNSVMFGEPGHAYIYFTYGMHYCFNVVTGPIGSGQGVLIRALEPLEGIDLMKARRNQTDIRNLCNGPAKLAQALGITKQQYGLYLLGGEALTINPYIKPAEIVATKRIGITKAVDNDWRFYVKDSPYISKP